MNCQDVQSRLVAMLDGELGSDRAEAEAHLASCPACRERLESLRRTLGLIQDLPATAPSAGFEARFLERLDREKAGSWRRWLQVWRWPRPALVGAGAVAAGLVLVALLLQPGGSAAPGPEEEIVRNLDLYADYEVLEQIDVLEDLEVIETLEEEG